MNKEYKISQLLYYIGDYILDLLGWIKYNINFTQIFTVLKMWLQ